MVGNPWDPVHPWDSGLGTLPDYYNSATFSDGVVECAGRKFSIHRVILCSKSKYFSVAFNSMWKESVDGVIRLEDDDVSTVETMLRFMYTDDYEDGAELLGGPKPSAMALNMKIYTIADKYDIPALKTVAMEKFKIAAHACWSDSEFCNIITEVYSSTFPSAQDLRAAVAHVATSNITELLEKWLFCHILKDTVGLAADITKLQASPRYKKKNKCQDCSGYSIYAEPWYTGSDWIETSESVQNDTTVP